MNNQYKIYILKDPRTLEIRYVGVTCKPLNTRLSNHIYYAKKRNCTHVHNWILSLLSIDLKPLIEILEVVTEDNWEEREKYWILKYKKNFNLTNIALGGRGLIRDRTLSSRQKSALGHYKPIYQINNTGNIVKEFTSISEASKQLNISRTNISNTLNSRNSTAGKFKWVYKSLYNINTDYSFNIDNSVGYTKNVIRKNIETLEIKNYESIIEAAIDNNLKYHTMIRIIKNNKYYENFNFYFK